MMLWILLAVVAALYFGRVAERSQEASVRAWLAFAGTAGLTVADLVRLSNGALHRRPAQAILLSLRARGLVGEIGSDGQRRYRLLQLPVCPGGPDLSQSRWHDPGPQPNRHSIGVELQAEFLPAPNE